MIPLGSLSDLGQHIEPFNDDVLHVLGESGDVGANARLAPAGSAFSNSNVYGEALWEPCPAARFSNMVCMALSAALDRLGIPLHEIAAILRQEAAFARSPTDRRNQIKSILTSLRRHPTKIAA